MIDNDQTGARETRELDRSRMTIGRGRQADLMISDPSLMELHAVVDVGDNERATFLHFDTQDDAFLDGRPIPSNTATILRDQAELRLTKSVRLTISTRSSDLAAGEMSDGRPKGTGLPVARSREDTLSMPIRAVPASTENAAGPASDFAPARAQSYELPAGSFEGGLQTGTRFAENYEVVRPLGAGGMGAVYKGIDLRRRREIAIKVISPSHMISPNALARFEREVAAAAAVHHPNIAEIYDSGVSNGTPFIIMQYVRGEELAALVGRERLEIPRAVDLMLSLCAAVQAVHERNVVHRDLKPENIKVVKEKRGETAVLLDFGVAKVVGSHPIFGANPKLTAADSIVGSVEYMAPEQASGSSHVDFAADQYAIGVILYRCLTQRLPFEGTNALAVMRKIIEGTFDGPRAHRPEIPTELEQVILRALNRYPENRFPSVGNFGEALLPFASERGRRLWMDELTSPNREPQVSRPVRAAVEEIAPKGAVAGATRVMPRSGNPRVPRTQVFSPSAGESARRDPKLAPPAIESRPRSRVATIAGASAVAIAFATALAVQIARSRSAPSPVSAVGSPEPARATDVARGAAPMVVSGQPPQAEPSRSSAVGPVDARPPNDEGHSTRPSGVSTAIDHPSGKATRHRTHRHEDVPTPLPKETPSHVKLVF